MNNIYVDELPKSCKYCPCSYEFEDVFHFCNAFDDGLAYLSDETYENRRCEGCPLKTLTDRLAEERKNLVKEIRQDLANKLTYNINDLENIMVICNKINSVLDKFERGDL